MPTEVSLEVDGLRLRTTVQADLTEQARSLLAACADRRGTAAGVRHGTVIQFGGPLFVLRREREYLRVCAMAYDADDPVAAAKADVTVPLVTLVGQLHLAQATGLGQADCGWTQLVVYPADLDWNGRIFMERRQASDPAHSGWYVGSAEPEDVGPDDDRQYLTTPVYSLLDRRPVAMIPLSLPAGAIAVIDGDRVVGVADENNVERWQM